MLGCLFLAVWQERVGFPWDFLSVPIAVCACGIFQHPVWAFKEVTRSLRALIYQCYYLNPGVPSWSTFFSSPFQNILIFVYI